VRLPAASRPAPVDAVPWPVRAAVVPAECADGLERARDVLAQIPDALEALRNLDTARPQEILDRLQRLQPEVNSLATRCRERVGD